jgi:hypothetical protein
VLPSTFNKFTHSTSPIPPSIGPPKRKIGITAHHATFLLLTSHENPGFLLLDGGYGSLRISLLHAMTNDDYVCRILAKPLCVRRYWVSHDLAILPADAAFMVGGGLAGHPSGPRCELSLSPAGTGCMSASQTFSNSFLPPLPATVLFIFSYPMIQAQLVTLCYRGLYRTANNQPAIRMMGSLHQLPIS